MCDSVLEVRPLGLEQKEWAKGRSDRGGGHGGWGRLGEEATPPPEGRGGTWTHLMKLGQ